jgi:hypothetical protein
MKKKKCAWSYLITQNRKIINAHTSYMVKEEKKDASERGGACMRAFMGWTT